MTEATTTSFRRISGGYSHCTVCSRPLSDHVSMAVGMGPICRENSGPRIDDLFDTRSDFDATVEGDFILIVDLILGGKSVTNDADLVVQDLMRRGILRDGSRLIYRDTMGLWAEMLHSTGQFNAFAPIADRPVTDRDEALALTRARYRHLGIA